MQFLYTGHINCPFEQNMASMIELLRACTMYKLPKPLLDFTQWTIAQLFPQSSPMAAFQVFLIVSEAPCADLDVRALRDCSAYITLRRAPQVSADLELSELARILERLVFAVEDAV